MQPLPVVKHLDVLEGRGRHVLARREAPAMHALILEAVEPANAPSQLASASGSSDQRKAAPAAFDPACTTCRQKAGLPKDA